MKPTRNSPGKSSPRATAVSLAEAHGGDRTAMVVGRITEQILDGALASGTTLPSEGTLAISYGVSRTVMREAMRMLRGFGLIEISQGKRPRVRPPDLQSAIFGIELLLRRNRASLLNLVEARRPLEEEIAGLAAERANDEHIRQLDHALHELVATTSLPTRIEADVAFHRVLAEATGNPVFVLLLEVLAGFLRESRKRTLNFSGVELAASGHRDILAAITVRDPVAARDAMRQHLRSAERDLRSIHSTGAGKP